MVHNLRLIRCTIIVLCPALIAPSLSVCPLLHGHDCTIIFNEAYFISLVIIFIAPVIVFR